MKAKVLHAHGIDIGGVRHLLGDIVEIPEELIAWAKRLIKNGRLEESDGKPKARKKD